MMAYADITKAREVLEWEPLYTVADIVKTAWAWENK
jgi:UDP-glucose 4-epimerase